MQHTIQRKEKGKIGGGIGKMPLEGTCSTHQVFATTWETFEIRRPHKHQLATVLTALQGGWWQWQSYISAAGSSCTRLRAASSYWGWQQSGLPLLLLWGCKSTLGRRFLCGFWAECVLIRGRGEFFALFYHCYGVQPLWGWIYVT